MRVLPSGTAAVLVEVEDLDEVLDLHAALADEPPHGVVDVVPAARTVLVVLDPSAPDVTTVAGQLARIRPRPGRRPAAEPVELPVVYDGEDLEEVAELMGCTAGEVVRRHTGTRWTVAFCGFAPGFGYLTAEGGGWDVPRRASPRTRVPAGAVGLAGPFSGVYPRDSPGGWQLIGRTDVLVFDLGRTPPALLVPGAPVRFVEVTP